MDYMSLTEKSNLEMDLKVLSISCHPGDVIIKFQGKYISDSEFDYHILQNEIQLATKNNEDIDIGQFCLVQDKPYGTWHRGKILDKANQKFEVELIDQGNVIKVPPPQIASAVGELFTIPPKVVNGIICNVLPLNEKWTSRAVNYFSSLVGQQFHGNVKIILPHQVFLLEIPKVLRYAIELSLAKYVDSESFRLLVELIHKFPANSHCQQMPDLLQQKEMSSDVTLTTPDCIPRFQKILDHLRPEFCVNTMEKIKISAAISPDRFYCHFLSWETELSKLTASMCCHYEASVTEAGSTLGSFSVVCAAKRKDGLWYRGVIQKLISCNEANIWFFDIGSSETIPFCNVQRLQPEFLLLPMLAIPCALSWSNDHVKSFRNAQLALFKEALMGHVVIAHIKDYCSEERLCYLSLYAKEFEFSGDCHLTNKQVPSFSPCSSTNLPLDIIDEKHQNLTLPETCTSVEVEYSETVYYKSMTMDLESVHVAYVEYAENPSNFWIRIDEFQNNYTEMMAEIAEKYNKCELLDMVLSDPKPGELCCALYAVDGHYYRAVVTELLNPQISVCFIDFGNTETVPFYDIKVLLPQFSTLPGLAMCCSLACAYPVDDVWTKSANDFFKQTVNGKTLLCHVLSKQKSKYVVEMRLSDRTDSSSDIVTLLVQAGFAEFWKVDLNSNSLNMDCRTSDNNTNHSKHHKKTQRSSSQICNEAHISLSTLKFKPMEQKSSFCTPESILHKPGVFTIDYKQYVFKPGDFIYVKCSHVDSPASFWCQMSDKDSKLSTLMDEMQAFYRCCTRSYQHGQVACVAKSSRTGKYYRASLVKYVSAHEAEVIFVDYGNTEKVSISELHEIKPQFRKLKGQAFHCCLSQVFSPRYAHCEWSASAYEDFVSLIKSSDVMKCTVVALFSRDSKGLCNAVNLETCFGNANKILTSKGHLNLRENTSSLHLHTFCYSDFDVAVGSKEDVFVTCVFRTGKFYCHLARNEKMFEKLLMQVEKIGNPVKPVGKQNELCIVKYLEDDRLYRAFTYPVKSSSLLLAFFVDFGDSQTVKKSDILSIPEDAYDILFQPMQAIPCCLAGMKESLLTVEAKAWFEEQCIGLLLSAIIVARDHEGQLELELHSGDISINQEIKKMLGITSIAIKDKLNVCEDSITVENEHASDSLDSLPISTFQQKTDSTHVGKSVDHIYDENVLCSQKLLKSIDLPQIYLEAGTTCLVYASHIDSPSSFFVQLDNQGEEIIQLVEELNQMSFQVIKKQDIERGLIVVAQYPDDEAYYRAEIKDIAEDRLKIEFIDYGNVANVDSSCIFTLPEKFLTIPRLSVPVYLTGVQKLEKHTEWSNGITKMFSTKIKCEQFSCKFICKRGLQWEVSITLEEESISEKLLQSFERPFKSPTVVTKNCFPKSDLSDFNVSNESAKEEATAEKNPYRLNNKILSPGLIEKVKNIYLSDSEMLFVTLANVSEESELKSHIASAGKQVSNRILAKDISEGMVCLAKSSKLQLWLRASVEKLMPRARKMVVFFVDHGSHEIISMHNAKMLSSKALSIPKQAIVCKWTGIKQIGENLFSMHLKSILQKEMQIIFIEFLESVNAWKVELLVDGLLLLRYLHSSSDDKKLDKTNTLSEVNVSSSQIPRKHLKSLEIFAGIVTSFYDPSSFFVQPADSLHLMATLSQLLQIPYDPTPIAGGSLRPDFPCLVKSPVDQDWYRAEIKSINRDFILLHLPDYGADRIIPYSDYGELKRIPTEISCLPALTYQCNLHGVMPDDGKKWSKDAISYCDSFVKNHTLMVLPIKNVGKNILEVSLYGPGNLSLNLVKKGLAKQVQYTGKSEAVYSVPSIRSETNPHLENVGCNDHSINFKLSSRQEKLDPSRLNMQEEGRWLDSQAQFPLQQNCLQG